jgi:large subunit ribosomal protein L18
VSTLATRNNSTGRTRRRRSVRKNLAGTSERPRLSVFRGNKNMSCQIIDDDSGITIASVSSLEKQFAKVKVPKTEMAAMLGKEIASRGSAKGVTIVVFDRGGYKYHGRVKALADAARENGLVF